MNREQLRNELPEPVRRHFEEVARMNPPDDLMDAAIAQVETEPRVTRFSLLPAFAALAATAVAAAVIAFGFFGLELGLPIGDEPSATPHASAGLTDGPLPAALERSFLGPFDAGTGAPQTARIRFQGDQFELQTWAGAQYLSRVTSVGPDQLRLVSISALGCEEDDEGIYTYALSAGEIVLTLGGEDACAARGDALTGEWLRSDCRTSGDYCLGELEAGTYSSGYFEPRTDGVFEPRFGALTYTVPDGWAAYADLPDTYGLTPQSAYAAFDGSDCYDCPGTRDTITILSDPGAATEDCGEDENVPGIGFGAEELQGWMQSHAGLEVGDVTESTINGYPARSFTITGASDWTGTCDLENPFVAVPVFYRVDSYHWALSPDQSYGVTLIDIGDGHTVAVMVDSANEADFADFVANTAPIIATFDFPPR